MVLILYTKRDKGDLPCDLPYAASRRERPPPREA